jgi:hypothetical protein
MSLPTLVLESLLSKWNELLLVEVVDARAGRGASVSGWQLICLYSYCVPIDSIFLALARLTIVALRRETNPIKENKTVFRSRPLGTTSPVGSRGKDVYEQERKVTFLRKEKYVLEKVKKTQRSRSNTNVAAGRKQMYQAEDQQDISRR